MAQGLVELQRMHPFTFEAIDVDADPELVQRYDELVPVLVHQSREVCRYFLDRDAVLATFRIC